MRLTLFIISLTLILNLSGCSSIQKRFSTGENLAKDANFSKVIIATKNFNIVSFYKASLASKSATIFIEGDGLAWLSKRRISDNPTPKNPVGLKLATNDPSENTFYLARPCQYIELDTEKKCSNEYWTSKRSSIEVIEAINDTITKIKKEFNIEKIRLVGFSGGASIATILAAKRNDVIDLRTVAGNLNIETFTKEHNITPLWDSINPVDFAEKLVTVPQNHYVSKNDKIITRSMTDSYTNALRQYDKNLYCINIIETNVESHSQGWDNYWQMQAHPPVECHNN